MTRRTINRLAALSVWCACICPAAADAQTRSEAIAKEQEEKASAAVAYTPSRLEVFLDQIEKGKWVLGVPRGWHVKSGSVYPSSGFALGGGYRRYIGYDSFVDAGALYSVKGYLKAEVAGFTPNHLGNRLDFSGSVGYIDATKVPFYGLGADSERIDHTTFRLNRSYVEGAAVLRPVKWLYLRLDGGLDDYTQKSGRGPAPSIETRFSAEDAPLLGVRPLYLRGEASAAVYWLESPGYSRRGGLYRFAYEEFNPLKGAGGTFGFARTELAQHVPLLRETWVVSLRARTESIVRESDVVPYFLMPSLGSGSTLRAYDTGRFRDRHSLLLSGELRWFPNRTAIDMALFTDFGTVAPSRIDLTRTKMSSDYGVGVRFHTPGATVLRVDVARGREGLRIVIAPSATF
jgi:hypothetical protein